VVFSTELHETGRPDPEADDAVEVIPDDLCVRETRRPTDDDDRVRRRLACELSSGVAPAKRAADDILSD
jgi:hypothetical protein